MGQIIAYARVSTDKQEFDRQVDALKAHGYDKLIQEKFTGTKRDRDGLNRLVEVVRPGDTIIVESLSRLGRNTIDILKLIDDLYTQGIAVKSLKEGIIDTSTPSGKFITGIFAQVAQLERDLTVQRVNEGLRSAKARGKVLGRPKVNSKKVEQALNYYDKDTYSINEIVKLTGVSRATLYRELKKRKSDTTQKPKGGK